MCWSRPGALLSGGCDMEGTFEAGVGMWRELVSRLSMRNARSGRWVFSFLAFKRLPVLLVITALYENTWSIHSDFQILHLETSPWLVSPCTLLPPCPSDCQLGGKTRGRPIHCPEVFRAPPWTGKSVWFYVFSLSRCWANSSPSLRCRRPGTSLESESDGNAWRSRSHSDELLPSMGSSPSTDSFLMEGEEKMLACTGVSVSIFQKEYFLKDMRLKKCSLSFLTEFCFMMSLCYRFF